MGITSQQQKGPQSEMFRGSLFPRDVMDISTVSNSHVNLSGAQSQNQAMDNRQTGNNTTCGGMMAQQTTGASMGASNSNNCWGRSM